MNTKGLLVVLSGPSGSGKDTVLEQVFKKEPSLQKSISMTTREIRESEVDGKDYYFVSKEYFEKQISAKNMLESAIYNTNYYGTPKAPVDKWLEDEKTVVLKIEVQGAEKIRKLYPDCVSIFVMPPSMQVLEKRLRGRNTDSEESILMRLDAARGEMQCAEKYDYIVFNDVLEDAVDDICAIIKAEKFKSTRMKNSVREVIKNA